MSQRSEIVVKLANFASLGKYTLSPAEARAVNKLFEDVAEVVNSLEAEEKESEEAYTNE